MKKIALFSIFTVISLAYFACKPETKPQADVFVVDSDGNAVEGATVRVYCVPGEKTTCEEETVVSEQESNAAGKTTHEIDHPAVLKVDAWKSIKGKIQLYEYRVNDTTVIDSTYKVDSTFYLFGESFVKFGNYGETGEATVVLSDSIGTLPGE